MGELMGEMVMLYMCFTSGGKRFILRRVPICAYMSVVNFTSTGLIWLMVLRLQDYIEGLVYFFFVDWAPDHLF